MWRSRRWASSSALQCAGDAPACEEGDQGHDGKLLVELIEGGLVASGAGEGEQVEISRAREKALVGAWWGECPTRKVPGPWREEGCRTEEEGGGPGGLGEG